MSILAKIAEDAVLKAFQEKLASVDQFADDLKTIHEDLADGIEVTADKTAKLLASVQKAIDALNKEVRAMKDMHPEMPKMPDLSGITKGIEALSERVDLEPVLLALDILVNRKPPKFQAEEWDFQIERDDFSNRMTSVKAVKLPPS